jgi:hypothetical protein
VEVWLVIVSTVVGAVSGFVAYFLWSAGPYPNSMWEVMIACAAIGCLLAVSFLLPWPWQHDEDDDEVWPWPGEGGDS